MPKRILVIANKRYSSWSLRPWLVMKAAGIPFTEKQIFLKKRETAEEILRVSPSGRVPALIEGKITVWESLAICEHLNDEFPRKQLWPAAPAARAMARSISQEMHAGFTALRSNCPMNAVRIFNGVKLNEETHADAARIRSIWREARRLFGRGGKFLFGEFSIADAMYAPVVLRFRAYGIEADEICRAYMDAVLELPAMQEWMKSASQETEIIPAYEL